MSALRSMLTEKDDQTFCVVKVSVAIGAALLPLLLVWGMALETWAVTHRAAFDLNEVLIGAGTFFGAYGVFLGFGGASIYWKSRTEADGTTTQTESMETRHE